MISLLLMIRMLINIISNYGWCCKLKVLFFFLCIVDLYISYLYYLNATAYIDNPLTAYSMCVNFLTSLPIDLFPSVCLQLYFKEWNFSIYIYFFLNETEIDKFLKNHKFFARDWKLIKEEGKCSLKRDLDLYIYISSNLFIRDKTKQEVSLQK